MTKTDAEIVEIYNSIKNYFKSKGYLKGSSSLAVKTGRMSDVNGSIINIPNYPLILNRTYFIDGNRKMTYAKYYEDITKHDKFIIEHIQPILKHFGVDQIQFIDSGKVKVINTYKLNIQTDKFDVI